MKRFALSSAAIGIAMLASAMNAEAQAASILKPVRLGVALGGSVPLGDFGSAVNTGYNATGTLALQPVGLPVGFRIDAGFNQFGIKGGGGNANVLGFTGNVVLPFAGGPDLAPYLIGGAGYYHESTSGTVLNGPAQNHFGYNAGAGLNIPLTGFTAFIEARYNRISENGTSTSFVPVTAGILF